LLLDFLSNNLENLLGQGGALMIKKNGQQPFDTSGGKTLEDATISLESISFDGRSE
jgi:hypothetical protein